MALSVAGGFLRGLPQQALRVCNWAVESGASTGTQASMAERRFSSVFAEIIILHHSLILQRRITIGQLSWASSSYKLMIHAHDISWYFALQLPGFCTGHLTWRTTPSTSLISKSPLDRVWKRDGGDSKMNARHSTKLEYIIVHCVHVWLFVFAH